MSAWLFNLMTDLVIQQNNIEPTIRHQLDLFKILDNLDFTDDIALVSHIHQHNQDKTPGLSMLAQQVGLKISQKTEVMILSFSNPSPVKMNGEDLPTTEEFTYLGSIVRLDVLTKNYFQSTSSHLLQPRQQSHHHHLKAMDQKHDEKRARRYLHSSSWTPEGK